MALLWSAKDPDEVLDYSVDWTDRMVEGDAIDTSDFSIAESPTSPPSLTIDTTSKVGNFAIVWLSGGLVDEVYYVLNRITTTGGRTMDQTVKLKIKTK